MVRIRLNLRIVDLWSIQLMPGVREKRMVIDPEHIYQEPTQVPLGEKPKA